jgi:NitT/TauT family transport system substrate-binding protein
LSVFAVVIFSACGTSQELDLSEKNVFKVAVSRLEATSLLRIAKHNGYFDQYGLEVEFIEDDLGKFSLKRLLDNEVDIATAAEFPFVKQSFKRDDLRLFATIHSSNKNVKLFVLKDSGVNAVSTIQGKTIATSFGTVGEFFLELLLLAHNVDPSEVNIVDMAPADISLALENGIIGGFALREPHVYRAQQNFDAASTVFPVDPIDEVYTATFNLVSKQETINAKRDQFENFLKALLDAEKYILEFPEESKQIIADDLSLDLEYLNDTWSDSNFSLQLTQALLVGMEDEAKWNIYKSFIGEDVPNLLGLIETGLLKKVKPEAMRIIVPN